MMLQVNEAKYSAALQKNFGYKKQMADKIASNYNASASRGQVNPLVCYPDPDAYYEGNILHMPNNKVFKYVEFIDNRKK